jgi:multiple sugar transport system permease protein
MVPGSNRDPSNQESYMQDNAVIDTPKKFNTQYIADNERFLGWLFLLPAVLYIILLVGVPFALAIAFSLADVTVGDTTLNFVGLENYARIVRTPEFWQSLKDTFGFAITAQIITIILANILAVLLSSDFRGKWFALVLIMLPWSTPIALGAIGWLWLLRKSPISTGLDYYGLCLAHAASFSGDPISRFDFYSPRPARSGRS